MSIALLTFENRVYFAERVRAPHEPFSSISDLIQGVWALNPSMARKVLRNRIFCSGDGASELDRGLVKVAAKRASFGYSPDELESKFGRRATWIKLKPPAPPIFDAPTLLTQRPHGGRSLMYGLSAWLDHIEKDISLEHGPLYLRHRKVAAAMISSEGKLLGAALNTNVNDRTRHAEVNLLQNWWLRERRPIPSGTELYVTLRCCRMCAAAIWESCEDPWSLKVLWLMNDPGPLAQETVLQTNTQARKRVARNPKDWAHLIEQSIDRI
jgi:hypothetical protein